MQFQSWTHAFVYYVGSASLWYAKMAKPFAWFCMFMFFCLKVVPFVLENRSKSSYTVSCFRSIRFLTACGIGAWLMFYIELNQRLFPCAVRPKAWLGDQEEGPDAAAIPQERSLTRTPPPPRATPPFSRRGTHAYNARNTCLFLLFLSLHFTTNTRHTVSTLQTTNGCNEECKCKNWAEEGKMRPTGQKGERL